MAGFSIPLSWRPLSLNYKKREGEGLGEGQKAFAYKACGEG